MQKLYVSKFKNNKKKWPKLLNKSKLKSNKRSWKKLNNMQNNKES